MKFGRTFKSLAVVGGFCLAQAATASTPDIKSIATHYADIAHSGYSDSVTTAQTLQQAVNKLIAQPTEANLKQAKAAWKSARVPYQQTEAYRFGNEIVDDWEGKVNAWPLDEGLIDYVASSQYGSESDENPYYTANVISSTSLMLSGRKIDTTTITPALLAETLHEVDGVEANVATGYHAIEFLLWGQDLNGSGAGAGKRPASDFDVKNCTGGNCERRAAYLTVVTDLLISELEWMTEQWTKDGAARSAVLADDGKAGLIAMFTGMGSLAYGEVAGERMKLGLMLHDPEEEHDCFSDNTHQSHYYDALGIKNVYTGTYKRIDGSTLSGPSLSSLVAHHDKKVDAMVNQRLTETQSKIQVLVDSAEKAGVAYDQLIGEGNSAGNKQVMAAINALLLQTKATEKAVVALNLSPIAFEGSDSLDAPETIK